MLYAPGNIFVEKVRLLFKRRVQDGQLAYLGDSDLPGARVEIEDKPGYVYCRFPGGVDANGKAKYSTPFPVRSAGAAFLSYPGAPVYIAYGKNNELQIVEAHYAELDKAGINTATLNPLHQQSKWVYLWQLTIGLASAVANSVNDSTLVTVKKFRHYVNNRFQTIEASEQADKPDTLAYTPAIDMHRYVAVWTDTYTNEFVLTASTTQSMFTPLDETDVNECVIERPPDAIPHKLFYLANNAGTVKQQAAKDVDVRQFLNTPQIHGFPNPVTHRERIQPDRQVLFAGSMVVTGSLEVLGSLVGIDSGEDGSGSGGGMTSFTVAADSGTPAVIANGDTATFAGGDGITTSVAGQTVTTAVNATVIRTTGTQAIGAGLTVDTPTVANLTNMQHDHLDADDGGTLDAAAIASGTLNSARIPALPYAPDNATYLVQVASSGLSAEQAMGALATGLVKNTTTTGVQSIAVAGTDYVVPATVEALTWKNAVRLATTAALAANTYNNGSSGVGATLTANANGALSIDGTAVASGNRVLIKDEAAPARNGIYTVTAAGSAGTPYILTRATDSDTGAKVLGTVVLVYDGVSNLRFSYRVDSNTAPTIGTTSITFTRFDGANISLSNLGTTAVNAAIVPDNDATYDLGTAATKWRETFANARTYEERSTPSTPATNDYVTYAKAVGGGAALFGKDDAGVEKQIGVSVAILSDQKSSGTAGGTSTSATQNARDINTEVSDPDGIVTISANKFVVVAGTYDIDIRAPFRGGSATRTEAQSRLYNVTGAAVVVAGQNATAAINGGAVTSVLGRFTSNGTDEYRIDTYTTVGRATDGLGASLTIGTETYTYVKLTKVA